MRTIHISKGGAKKRTHTAPIDTDFLCKFTFYAPMKNLRMSYDTKFKEFKN